MRILQLSDIHLNHENKSDLKDYYIEALLTDLTVFHNNTPIDVILITGDLIDKGGESFPDGTDVYKVFKEEIIAPIAKNLNISDERIFFIPGNHDVERRLIVEESEFFLGEKLNPELANKRCEAFQEEFNNDNKRIKRFKDFEKLFHEKTPGYTYSNNESLAIVETDGQKIGFALVNDSWRCSSELRKEQHFIGYKQLLRARNLFNENKTDLNIAVFHHPLNAINDNERDEIKAILKTKNFDIAIFGHSHRHEADHLISSVGGYLSINGRSAFSQPKEQSSLYQPGYNILDINPSTRSYTITARKYISNGYRFDKDTDSLPDGQESNILPKNDRLVTLAEDSNNDDKELPDSYQADVDRIVSLLIGESIYPDSYAFIRELIQNSVDACNRIKEKHTHLTPKITINIDAAGNYIEVVDEGDGMSKSIIKNHFSVLGKSISQEFNDNSGKFNLISKFGIGFISTFIVAEKVVVSTKSEEDDHIMFEIEDVFTGFKYISTSGKDEKTSSGTSVRVYLKKGFDTNAAYENVRKYCRHIENLEINFNSSIVKIDERWNVEDSTFKYSDKNPRYEVRLGFGNSGKYIMASYCGFLITTYPSPLLPYRCPVHIGGEINFFPKAIDFDISRTNIIPTGKSESCKREISLAIKKLFRDILENKPQNQYQFVVNYLHYYLQNYDANRANMEASHSQFYSKKELISLCSEHTIVDYQGKKVQLGTVLSFLKMQSIDRIFYQNSAVLTDYQAIVVQYLDSKNYLIFRNRNTAVSFHDSQQQTTSFVNVIQLIAAEHGIAVQEISSVHPSMLTDMKLDKSQFHEKIQTHLSAIENEYSVVIEIGKFSATTKPSVSHANQIFMNYNHATFQSLLPKLDAMPDEALKIYLLGLLGLKL